MQQIRHHPVFHGGGGLALIVCVVTKEAAFLKSFPGHLHILMVPLPV